VFEKSTECLAVSEQVSFEWEDVVLPKCGEEDAMRHELTVNAVLESMPERVGYIFFDIKTIYPVINFHVIKRLSNGALQNNSSEH